MRAERATTLLTPQGVEEAHGSQLAPTLVKELRSHLLKETVPGGSVRDVMVSTVHNAVG